MLNNTPEEKFSHPKIRFAGFLLAVVLCLFSTTTYGGNRKMEPLYDFKDAITLKPQVYATGARIGLSLFPVPQDNAVGTNDLINAITIISFPGGLMDMEHYFKDALQDLSGSGLFLPVISDHLIGFGQGRRFLLFNFKLKIHERYRIVFPLEETIEQIAIADAQRNKFIFKVQEYNRQSNGNMDYTISLQLIDLGEKKVKLIKKMDIGTGTVWTSVLNRNFLYDLATRQLQIYDMNFELSGHPLGDVIKKNKNKVDFTRFAIHPTLPFAILYAGTKEESLISWEKGRPNSPCNLWSDAYSATQFSFSPDGKWVTFKRRYKRDENYTYLMPISEKYPNFLGSPILLSDDYFNEGYFAWTKNPISFVGAGGSGKIYRWELTNEAHPESDKATFHDFIVEKDLEKLTKEKKQGLWKEN